MGYTGKHVINLGVRFDCELAEIFRIFRRGWMLEVDCGG